MERLLQDYPNDHPVILYEAAQYPHTEPIIHEVALRDLPHAPFSMLSTLYIAPASKKTLDEGMLKRLGIALEDLR